MFTGIISFFFFLQKTAMTQKIMHSGFKEAVARLTSTALQVYFCTQTKMKISNKFQLHKHSKAEHLIFLSPLLSHLSYCSPCWVEKWHLKLYSWRTTALSLQMRQETVSFRFRKGYFGVRCFRVNQSTVSFNAFMLNVLFMLRFCFALLEKYMINLK